MKRSSYVGIDHPVLLPAGRRRPGLRLLRGHRREARGSPRDRLPRYPPGRPGRRDRPGRSPLRPPAGLAAPRRPRLLGEPPQGQGRPPHPGRRAAPRPPPMRLGQGRRDARGHPRLPPLRQEGLRRDRGGPRLRHGVFRGHGLRQDRPPSPGLAGHQRPRRLRPLPQGRPRQARRPGRVRARRGIQDGLQHVHGEGLHAGPPRGDGVLLRRPFRPVRGRGGRSPGQDPRGVPRPRRPRLLPGREGQGGRARRRLPLRGRAPGPPGPRRTGAGPDPLRRLHQDQARIASASRPAPARSR